MQFGEKYVDIGKGPYRLCINYETNTIFVSCYNSDEVFVIDGNIMTVVNTIHLTQPQHLAINPKTNLLYVIHNENQKIVRKDFGDVISVIDVNLLKIIKTISREKGFGNLIVNPNLNKIFTITNDVNEQLGIIDENNNFTSKKINGKTLFGYGSIDVNLDTNTIYCIQEDSKSNSELVINKINENLKIQEIFPDITIKFHDYFDWIAVNSAGDVFFTTGDSPWGENATEVSLKDIYKFDSKTNNFFYQKTTLSQIESVVYNQTKSQIYVSETNFDNIVTLNEQLEEVSRTILPPLKKQKSFWRDPAEVQMCCNPTLNRVYFTSQNMDDRKQYCLYFFDD